MNSTASPEGKLGFLKDMSTFSANSIVELRETLPPEEFLKVRDSIVGFLTEFVKPMMVEVEGEVKVIEEEKAAKAKEEVLAKARATRTAKKPAIKKSPPKSIKIKEEPKEAVKTTTTDTAASSQDAMISKLAGTLKGSSSAMLAGLVPESKGRRKAIVPVTTEDDISISATDDITPLDISFIEKAIGDAKTFGAT